MNNFHQKQIIIMTRILVPIMMILFTIGCNGDAIHSETADGVKAENAQIFIRVNQVGFRANDYKIATVISDADISGSAFKVIESKTGKESVSGKIVKGPSGWGNFPFGYSVDFTSLKKEGRYYIDVAGKKSPEFLISSRNYITITDSLLKFFKIQRCGPTNPILHDVCHLYDANKLVGELRAGGIDVTGGWHDAGDYTKFLNTTAFTTYLLLFSYEFNRTRYENDSDKNGVPDILDEAKIGLDWLLRCNYAPGKLVIQVQDLKDQTVGWRMPENDTLRYERPAFAGIGKNLVGLYSATMSLASRIWKDRIKNNEFSERCLNAATNIYAVRNAVPNVDKNPIGMYQDSRFWGKLALGAIEMYNTTKKQEYLREAQTYADSAGSDYWWSWGDMNALAHYKIAKHVPRFSDYILNNLIAFNDNRNKNLFQEGTVFSWGTSHTFLGIALHAILYRDLTGKNNFDSLAFSQRDYILGNNPWGVSFIYGYGEKYTKYFHSQVAYFNGGYFPGGVAAGPAPKAILDGYNIERKNFSYNKFNSADVLYYDDRNDYITNEPTIVTNATAIFVFGNLYK